MGTALVQLARTSEFGASFVAATSTQTNLLLDLGVDRPIDYTAEEWWGLEDFRRKPFDVIIDCAEGASAWRRLQRKGPRVLKNGGRFLALVLQEWHIPMTRWYHLPALLLPPLFRQIRSSCFGRLRYSMYAQTLDAGLIAEVLALAHDGLLRPVIDPAGPFPWTADGSAAAVDLLRSRHAHGKVVIAMDAERETPHL